MPGYFVRYLLGFLCNLAGFQNKFKEIKEQTPAKPQFLEARTLQ